MECQDVYKLMNRYIDDEISPEEEKVLEVHLGRCKSCQTKFSQLKELKTRLNTVEPTHTFTFEVMAKIKAEKESKFRQMLPKSLGGWAKVAAVVFLCFFLVSQLFPKPGGEEVIISKGQVRTEMSQEGTQQMTVVDGEIRVKGIKGGLTAINSKIVFEKADLHNSIWAELWRKIKELFSGVTQLFAVNFPQVAISN